MTRNTPPFGQWRLSWSGAALVRSSQTYDTEQRKGIKRLRGESWIIAAQVVQKFCPVGILLDRLTEYPEECDAPPEVVAEAVAQLRERNPNGNETNW